MDAKSQLEALYAEYKKTVEKVVKDARPFAGFMGLGGGPKDDPCHRKFYEGVCLLTGRLAQEGMSAAEAKDCASYILGAQCAEEKEGLLYWTMMAAHGAVKPLLPLLTREDAEALADYERLKAEAAEAGEGDPLQGVTEETAGI